MNEEQNMERSIGRLEGKVDLVIISVNDLSSSFKNLEQGRLSKLELAFNTAHVEMGIKAKNSALFFSAVASIVGSVISGIVLYLLLK